MDREKAYGIVLREKLLYCIRESEVAQKYVRVVQDSETLLRRGIISGISCDPLPVCNTDGEADR